MSSSLPSGRARAAKTTRPLGDLAAGVRVGRFNRLKEHLPLGLFLQGLRPPPGPCVVHASLRDCRALHLDLRGCNVALARGPRLLPTTDRGACDLVPLEGDDVERPPGERPRAILDAGSGPLVPYQFNVGCAFACGFCNSFSRRTYRLRSPERVVADLTHVRRTYGVNRFYMVNHLLNCDAVHLRELVERLEAAALDIHWVDSCRASGLDADMLERLRGVGVARLVWGVDCASDRMSRLMQKGVRADRVCEILAASHRAGITNDVNLIVGMPHETERDFDQACRTIERMAPFVHRFQVAPYDFFAASPLGRHPEAYGLSRAPDGTVVGPDGTRWTPGSARQRSQALVARLSARMDGLLHRREPAGGMP